MCSDAIQSSVTLAVPTVLQTPYEWLCWAAVSASIGNYIKGYSYTAKQIAQYYYGTTNFDRGADLCAVKSILLNRYSITYSKLNDTTPPSDAMIYKNLSAGFPMYAVLKYSGGYHAAVIRGYNKSAQRIYVMDPEYGYAVANKQDGKYKYTSAATGISLTVCGYAAYKD